VNSKIKTMLFVALFWLSIPLSLVLSAAGIWKNNYWLVLMGALLLVPVAYYLSGAPDSKGIPALLPLFQVGSAAALREGYKGWAWLLLLPALAAALCFVGTALVYQIAS